VTSGVYAYIANPMQLSGVALLVVLGLALQNIWVVAAGVTAHIYSLGLAGWDEGEDLRRRFGDDWTTYRRAVRRWVPRVRPWRPPDGAPPRAAACAARSANVSAPAAYGGSPSPPPRRIRPAHYAESRTSRATPRPWRRALKRSAGRSSTFIWAGRSLDSCCAC